MKYVIDLLNLELKTAEDVLSDKKWGNHKDNGMNKTFRQNLEIKVGELKQALEILNVEDLKRADKLFCNFTIRSSILCSRYKDCSLCDKQPKLFLYSERN
jgi:hypothetical protein